MLYSHALAGSHHAAQFLSPNNLAQAPDIAFNIMSLKLKTYLRFNDTYPGFGGFLPWYTGDTVDISPTWDWVNRVPALDNGYILLLQGVDGINRLMIFRELLWAVYSIIQVLETSPRADYQALANGWQVWLDYTKTTAVTVGSF
jgi:hypothetical protein